MNNEKGTYISKNAIIGKNISLGYNCIVEDNVVLGNNIYIDNNVIIREGTVIGDNSSIGANSIIGEHLNSFYLNHKKSGEKLVIGDNAIIRSNTIIYTDSVIGNNLQTGHHVTIREKSKIGNYVSIGTISDIQGYCIIGDYVRMHSDVHIGQGTKIDNFVWIFPRVTFTNDPIPPSDILKGSHVHEYAIIATNSVILPGKNIAKDSLVGAGSVVTKDVDEYSVVCGNPAKHVSDIRDIINKETGEKHYPWREHFGKNMPWENEGFIAWAKNNNIII